jgi:hypothetical protein
VDKSSLLGSDDMSALVGRKAHGRLPWKIGATVGIVQMTDKPKSKDGQANRLPSNSPMNR